jgi:ComF family protein
MVARWFSACTKPPAWLGMGGGPTAWPTLCLVCQGGCNGGLCGPCQSRFAPPTHRCEQCALRLPDGAGPRCGQCLSHPPPQNLAVAAVDYTFPWAAVIADFKFHQQPDLAAVLAPLLSAASLATPQPDLVLPMPLSPQRLAERGYNQAWELARRVAAARGLPAQPDLLQRPVDLPHQAQLDRAQRLANLRGAFYLPPAAQAQVRGRRVALVDDVMTTGATAHQATRALLQAGALAVDLWMLARTPAP